MQDRTSHLNKRLPLYWSHLQNTEAGPGPRYIRCSPRTLATAPPHTTLIWTQVSGNPLRSKIPASPRRRDSGEASSPSPHLSLSPSPCGSGVGPAIYSARELGLIPSSQPWAVWEAQPLLLRWRVSVFCPGGVWAQTLLSRWRSQAHFQHLPPNRRCPGRGGLSSRAPLGLASASLARAGKRETARSWGPR